MATYPLSTLAAQVSAAGISAPSYNDILQSLIASYQSIFGSDAYLGTDSQDYQLLAVFAQAINDANQTAIAAYQSFRPGYSQGAALSSLVKINGLARNIASNSTAVGNVVGQAGTIITNGVVNDQNGNNWNLPASVTIPVGGSVSVTVTAQESGSITAPAGTITTIQTPVRGWQSFTNTSDAVPGAAVELDAALRKRQSVSTGMAAQTTLQSIFAAVSNLAGVTKAAIYENDTNTTDANGIPANSISVVVEGGSAIDICTSIANKKSPGTGTYGNTTEIIEDPAGVPISISYYPLQNVPIYIAVTIKALTGYVSTTGTALQQAIADFINALKIGEDVYLSWLYGPAGLSGDPLSATFKVTALTIGLSAGSMGSSDLTIAFNEAATCSTADITMTVT